MGHFSCVWVRHSLVSKFQKFGKRSRKLIFKVVAMVAILDFLLAHLAILRLLGALMLIIKFSIQLDYRRCPKYEFLTFFAYKCIWPIQMHGEEILPCRQKVKHQHRTIILVILVDLLSPIICAKIKAQGLFGSGEEDL